MKRFKYLVFLTIYLHCFSVWSQSFKTIDKIKSEVVYEYKYCPDSTYRDIWKIETMLLKIGNNYTIFIAKKLEIYDSLLVAFKSYEKKSLPEQTSQLTKYYVNIFANFRIIKNYPGKNEIFLLGNIIGTPYKTEQKVNFEWKIDEKADSTILQYKCKRAFVQFAGRTYEAWFTPEIPIAEGPYKFGGLPGLILFIQSIDKTHVFEAKRFLNHSIPKDFNLIQMGTQIIEVSPQDYVKAFQAANQRMANMLLEGNMIRIDDNEARIKAMQRFRSDNNFIEKYN